MNVSGLKQTTTLKLLSVDTFNGRQQHKLCCDSLL